MRAMQIMRRRAQRLREKMRRRLGAHWDEFTDTDGRRWLAFVEETDDGPVGSVVLPAPFASDEEWEAAAIVQQRLLQERLDARACAAAAERN